MRLPDFFKTPRNAAITGVILGLALGLLVGWVLWPVDYTDAVPKILSQQYQEEYLRMSVDSYRINKDVGLAAQRWVAIGPNAPALLKAIEDNPGSQQPKAIDDFKLALETMQIDVSPPGTIPPTSAAEMPGAEPSTPVSPWVWLIGSVLALGVIGGAVYLYLLKPLFAKRPATGEVSAAQHAQQINRSVEKTDFAGLGLAKPITQNMTTYVLGDDLYDESFSIDSPAGEFLGEYGVGVSETMGVGEPKKVTAVEIWLFDKNDIKTATKVLMSAHAYADPNIRARLEAKGELVPVQPQGQVVLETATLQLLATVVDLEYGRGNLPDKSYFERITLELAIWPKQ
ncbi:MAG: hypothetical protein ACOYZ6_04355 [Chloroflexota bacterium]